MPGSDISVIGSLDSSGGAGINQDIRVAALHGLDIRVCVANLTLQNENGVEAIHPVPLHQFQTQLEHLLGSEKPLFIKIGALSCTEQVQLLQHAFARPRRHVLILDPVILPSRGKAFLDDAGIAALRELAMLTDFICPNLPELAMLCGREVGSFPHALASAKACFADKGVTVLLKGGHGRGCRIREACVGANSTRIYTARRRHWEYGHGTGCAFALAFAIRLSRGIDPGDAMPQASAWVRRFYGDLNAGI